MASWYRPPGASALGRYLEANRLAFGVIVPHVADIMGHNNPSYGSFPKQGDPNIDPKKL